MWKEPLHKCLVTRTAGPAAKQKRFRPEEKYEEKKTPRNKKILHCRVTYEDIKFIITRMQRHKDVKADWRLKEENLGTKTTSLQQID